MTKEMMKNLMTMMKKEQLLSELIVWLKTKGLWEEAQSAISIKIIEGTEIDDSK